jgi:hypothetical protein
MGSGAELMQNFLDALLPNRAAPTLARVIKAHEGPGKTTYSVDVRVVKAGTFEETDQVIAEVPISPIWVGKSGKGIYAIPPEDTLVIIEYIGWNPAYPYVSGVWSDEYQAGEFSKGQLVITDGEGLKLGVDVDSLIMFKTKTQSLKAILEKLIDEIAGMQTMGPPQKHRVSPDSVAKILAVKQDIAGLLK